MPVIDIEKRRKVMQRSRQLGHCICDPTRPCPCDVFTEQGICPCAGERPDPVAADQVKLTSLVHNGGCASKIAASDLEAILGRLELPRDPAVICGLDSGDDAGVYRLSEHETLVQTVDVMTPCVDDAYLFGRICAANCLSDIYAMGGTPRTALSILAFPSETLSGEIMYQMMAGATEVLRAAGVALIGGHSIKDQEIKLGFAITGTIDPQRAIFRGTARPGDRLVLTKRLGTGVIGFSRQINRASGLDVARAERSMATLNAPAAEAMLQANASACTDVTGFGIFGHLLGMVRHSSVTAEIWAESLPAFDGVLSALRSGVVPGAIERNLEHVQAYVDVDPRVDEAWLHLALDAQTSGGLLIAVPEERHEELMDLLHREGIDGWTVGRVTENSTGRIRLISAEGAAAAGNQELKPGNATVTSAIRAEVEEASTPPSNSALALRGFGTLMRATGASGAVDARTKELINFALVLLSRCEPCIRTHLAKAREMGITQEELDEVAWCATSMGGAPVRMFYMEALKAEQPEHAVSTGHSCC